MATSIPLLKFSARKNNGQALSGGLLYTYRAETNVPQDTYTTAAGDVANSNPIELDSRGEADVYLGIAAYKFVLYDSAGNLQYEVDNISNGGIAGSLQTVATIDALRNLPGGSSDYVYVASYSRVNDGGQGWFSWEAVTSTADDDGIIIAPSSIPSVGRWRRQFSGPVDVHFFGANGLTGDDSEAIENAVASTINLGYSYLIFPPDGYFLTSTVTIPDTITVILQGLISGTGTLNILGVIDASDTQIFGSSLTVTLGGNQVYKPEYWGAKGDGATDDSAAIVATYNSMRVAGKGEIHFRPKAVYLIAYGFHIPKNSTTRFKGATWLANTTFCQGVIPTGGTTRAMLWIGGSLTGGATLSADYENISIYGDGGILDGNALNQIGTVGIEIPGYSTIGIETTPAPIEANLFRVKNIIVKDLTCTRAIWYGGNIEGPENVLFDNVRFLYAGTNGCSVKSGRNITFERCEASFTRGPNIIDPNYGAGWWHEPNSSWQVMENIVHNNCYAEYNYMAGFRLWNPGQDAGASIFANHCRSYRNSWNQATGAHRVSVSSTGFIVWIEQDYVQKYLIEINNCTATEEYNAGLMIERRLGGQTNAVIRVNSFTSDNCNTRNVTGYDRSGISVISSNPYNAGTQPAEHAAWIVAVLAQTVMTRVYLDSPRIWSPITNTNGYQISSLYPQCVYVSNPKYYGPSIYNAVYGNVPATRFSGGEMLMGIDPGEDQLDGILGSATKFYKPIRFASFDTSAEPTEILTNEMVVWQNDNNAFKGIYVNDDGLKLYIPMMNGIGAPNQLMKTNSDGDGWKPSAVTISEDNVISGAERINLNGAVDAAGWSVNVIGNVVAHGPGGGAYSAFGSGAPNDANIERIVVIHDGATADVRSLATGTGTLRALRLLVNTTAAIICQTNGDVTMGRNVLFTTSAGCVNYFAGPKDFAGLGSPEGRVTATVGSTYRRSDGGALTSFYVKESGAAATGWVGK